MSEICGLLFALGYGSSTKSDDIIRDFFETEGFDLDINLFGCYKYIFFKPNLPKIDLDVYRLELKKCAELRAKELGIEFKEDDDY